MQIQHARMRLHNYGLSCSARTMVSNRVQRCLLPLQPLAASDRGFHGY